MTLLPLPPSCCHPPRRRRRHPVSIAPHRPPSPLPLSLSPVCPLTVVRHLASRDCLPTLSPMGSQEMTPVTHVPDAAKQRTAAEFPWLQLLHSTEGCELLGSLLFQLFPLCLAADLLSRSSASYLPPFFPPFGRRLPIFNPWMLRVPCSGPRQDPSLAEM